MENISEFNLNLALQHWLARLGESPQVKAENLKELESHVCDSMSQLEGKGLSSEESFLVATHRVGSPEKLEPEFAKVNRNPWSLIVHGLILVFFSVVCWLLWGTLHLPQMTQAMLARLGVVDQVTGYGALPAFTRMMMGLGNFMFVPPLLAFIYCLYVWFRKSSVKSSWMGFFASTTAFLIFITLPTLIAVVMPLIALVKHLPAK